MVQWAAICSREEQQRAAQLVVGTTAQHTTMENGRSMNNVITAAVQNLRFENNDSHGCMLCVVCDVVTFDTQNN